MTPTPRAAPSLSARAIALAALAEASRSLGDCAETEWLHPFSRAIERRAGSWRAAARRLLEGEEDGSALVRLAGAQRLTAAEVLAVTLLCAVETDVRVGRVVRLLQDPLGSSRPSAALLDEVFGDAGGVGRSAILHGRAFDLGLLEEEDSRRPGPERTLRVPPHVARALDGHDAHVPGVDVREDPREVALAPSTIAEARRHAAGLGLEERGVLCVRGSSRSEVWAVAHELARSLGRRPALVQGEPPPGLGVVLQLRRLLPVYAVSLGPGECFEPPSLPHYGGPSLVLSGRAGVVEAPGGGGVLRWTLAPPAPGERAELWRHALGAAGAGAGEPDPASELAQSLATRLPVGCGRIAHLGRVARQLAASEGRERPCEADVLEGAWNVEGGELEALAHPVRCRIGDGVLQVDDRVQRELDALVTRCQQRESLSDGLGPAGRTRYVPGVRALFVGPSGTGKTLMAGRLATLLGLPLFRVDLASLTSRYLGDTEKRISEVCDAGEDSGVVLLFDEADSLFGARTAVSQANDRWSNAITNHLLQRIETYSGIAVLTANSQSRIDGSFLRRLDAVLEVSAPGPESRRSLWLAHLGEAHDLTASELNKLAALATLNGGDIRNCVLSAAATARAGDRSITFDDVLTGIAPEYRKAGKRVPAELARGRCPRV